MKRIAIRIFMLVLIASVAFQIGRRLGASESHGVPKLDIEKIAELVSLRVNVADVIQLTKTTSLGIPWTVWKLPIGGTKVLFVLKGDCLLATDLKSAEYKNINMEKKTFTMALPEPIVKSPRVNHDPEDKGGSYFYAISPLWGNIFMPSDGNRITAINAAMEMAQNKVKAAGNSPEILQAAKENAEGVLNGLYSGLGWMMTVEWKK